MTAVEWLINEVRNSIQGMSVIVKEDIFKQAKEMEKQQIINAYKFGLSDEYVIGSDKYYNETYGSKGSDGHELDDDIPPTSQYFPTSSQTEISDEEIFKQSIKEMEESYGSGVYDSIDAHFRGAIWYREQLKKKI